MSPHVTGHTIVSWYQMQLHLGSKIMKSNAVFNNRVGLLAVSSRMIARGMILNAEECTKGIREHQYLVSNLQVQIFH
jgi:hypothetical protein